MVHTQKRKCPICGEIFKPEHPNSKYCSPKCRLIARKRQVKRDVREYRDRYQDEIKEEQRLRKERLYEAINEAYMVQGSIVMEQYHIGKGTTMLGPKPKKDFTKEQKVIENEFRRLNLPLPPRQEI